MTWATALPWIIFNVFILAMLALDLGVFHKKGHVVTVKEATIWTSVWISLSMIFCIGLLYFKGQRVALEFFTGYLIEYSLSVDNIFVFVLIFTMFKVPASAQHRVLFWGIIGAFVMRGTLIAVGAALLHRFHWIIYIFGAFLIYTGVKMGLSKDEGLHPEDNPIVGWFQKHMRMIRRYEGEQFFVRIDGKLFATPLALVLVVVETTDLIFAVDSIPAIFGVTRDPFIVYTSNVFAILGLRSLYFLLAGIVRKFYYLKYALSAILTFVGVKMVIVDIYKIPITISLVVIISILLIAVIASAARAARVRAAGGPEVLPIDPYQPPVGDPRHIDEQPILEDDEPDEPKTGAV